MPDPITNFQESEAWRSMMMQLDEQRELGEARQNALGPDEQPNPITWANTANYLDDKTIAQVGGPDTFSVGPMIVPITSYMNGGSHYQYRYIVDPTNPNSYIDMKHVLNSAMLSRQLAGTGEATGWIVDFLQYFSDGSARSAFKPSDYKSNTLGDYFGQRLNPDLPLGPQFRSFMNDYAAGVLPAPAYTPPEDLSVDSIVPLFIRDFQTRFLSAEQTISPLVLDLDGDGIELNSVTDSKTTRFDHDLDGMREATGWVKSDDGLLVLDRNNDTIINDGSELFGTQDRADSGFNKLDLLDTNNDNLITTADAQFNNLRVWRDLDQDAFSDQGELFSLNQLGITEISTGFTRGSQMAAGNEITDFSTYKLGNGTSRQIVDVWFGIDRMDSRYDFSSTRNTQAWITKEILELPNLKGYGKLPDLAISMAKDSTLLNMLKSFDQKVKAGNYTNIEGDIQTILFRWAGVDGTVPDRGPYVNNRELAFVERMMGEQFNQLNAGTDPMIATGPMLSKIYSDAFTGFSRRLMTELVPNSSVKYNWVTDRLSFNGTREQAITLLNQRLQSTTSRDQWEANLLVQYLGEEQNFNVIEGTSGSDNLNNSSANDSIVLGRDGSDIINGGAGFNIIDGGNGDDVITAQNGRDIINGGVGNDTIVTAGAGVNIINGGAGIDTLVNADFSLATTNISINNVNAVNVTLSDGSTVSNIERFQNVTTGSGNDSFTFTGNQGNVINAGAGNDTIRPGLSGAAGLGADIVDGGAGDDLLFLDYSSIGYTGSGSGMSMTPGSVVVNRSSAPLDYEQLVYSNIERFRITGTVANDIILGGSGMDIITAGEGDDTITSYGGDDTLNGGGGNDTFHGGAGRDFMSGWGGDDTFLDFNSGDSIDGGEGIDSLLDANFSIATENLTIGDNDASINIYLPDGTGIQSIERFVNFTLGSGSDTVNYTKRENNTINAGGGDDTVNAGLGVDSLDGGAGDDLLILDYSGNTYTGSSPASGIRHSWTNVGATTITTFSANRSADNFTDYDAVTFTNFERFDITGTLANDSFWTGAGNDIINTLGGDDNIHTWGGNDTINAGAGNDTIEGGAGNDVINGGDGEDTVNNVDFTGGSSLYIRNGMSSSITSTTDSVSNVERFTGTLVGTSGTDDIHLEGSDSNSIYGRDGGDILNAGGGTSNYVDGGEGRDVLMLDFVPDKNGIYVYGEAAGDGFWGSLSNQTAGVGFNRIERVGLNGTGGSDDISIGDTDDTINGAGGDDLLSGLGGDDTLNGGAGNDTMIGGAGNDTYIVDTINDVVDEAIVNATEIDLVQSTVTYTLGSNVENLTLLGTSTINGTGNSLINNIIGNSVANQLEGLGGNDFLDGSGGADILSGGDGGDRMAGGSGMDTLLGGNGNDRLTGGSGNDTLTGGAGIDQFIYTSSGAFTVSAIGVDQITDFVVGTDKIVLDKTTFMLNSDAGTGFNVAADFASVAEDADVAGSTAGIVYSRATGSLFYNENRSGAGLGSGARFATLSGVPNVNGIPQLTAADFTIQN